MVTSPLTKMEWWVWVLVAFLLLTIEFFATTAHIGFFAVGAFLVALIVGVGIPMPLWGQLLTFSISSVILLVFVRPIVVRKLGLNITKVVDTLVGEQAIALSDHAGLQPREKRSCGEVRGPRAMLERRRLQKVNAASSKRSSG